MARFLKDRASYGEFVREWTGCDFVDHLPVRNATPLPVEWLALYEATYGQLSAVWFTDPEGCFQQGQFAEYCQSGEWRASWDCGPEFDEEALPSPAEESLVMGGAQCR